MRRIEKEIELWPKNTAVGVFPEYCWGRNDPNSVLNELEDFKTVLPNNLCLIFGTTKIQVGDIYTNSAIIVSKERDLEFIPKSHTLLGERERNHVSNGSNPGVVHINDLSIGVLICADLWDGDLVKFLAHTQNADIIAVPAFTTVPKGFANYAKQQWYSLSISRSREFVVPLIIADHAKDGLEYDVGKATNIADPSKKHQGMSDIRDFLDLPQGNTVISNLNFKQIQQYRDYRLNSGLLE
ncbi:MAG: hypothetical protein ACXAD7_26555 [Candidatus Kariarchaeaceae archaeon]|jgi:predicted amidohydrolase